MKEDKNESGLLQKWNPHCDIRETPTELVIFAELPGLKKEEVKIEYDEKNSILSLFGEKKQEMEENKELPEGGKFHLFERKYGCFKRSFHLPDSCKTKINEINAKSVDGVLEVHCPKETEVETPIKRNIKIN
jgi:HSP20 family protein